MRESFGAMVTGVLPEELELEELELLLLLLEDELLDEELLDEELEDELLDDELEEIPPEFDELPPQPTKPGKVIAIQMAMARSVLQCRSGMSEPAEIGCVIVIHIMTTASLASANGRTPQKYHRRRLCCSA